ncbi:homeobox protein Rhox13-like [Arvicola amphibius]|uniref:homeobox protein Rhox13-like n=1 Tax=Arvicola amphibius TaxID=1047088 RepID=UPI0018E3E21B|nr:homeobox protein Rhox13-like [Arvicola amphibius]
MVQKLYYEHKYYTLQDCKEEIVNENGVVPSTSAAAMEADGGHSGGFIGRLNFKIYESSQGQDSESVSEESDANVRESSSHPDSSLELDPEELNTSVAGVARIPRSHRGCHNLFHFIPRQIKKMERVFKKSQYPDLAAREELARALKVPEAKLKVWFANRRAKERKKATLVHLENTPPVQDIIILRDIKEDSS